MSKLSDLHIAGNLALMQLGVVESQCTLAGFKMVLSRRLQLPQMPMPLRNEVERAQAQEKVQISVNTIYKYHKHLDNAARRDLVGFAARLLLQVLFSCSTGLLCWKC